MCGCDASKPRLQLTYFQRFPRAKVRSIVSFVHFKSIPVRISIRAVQTTHTCVSTVLHCASARQGVYHFSPARNLTQRLAK